MKKKIIIYGAGFEAEKFYYLIKDKVDIKFLIDRNAEKNSIFHGKRIYKLEEKIEELKIKKNKVIVCATHNVYKEIKNTLEKIGLLEFEDFIWFMDIGKKIAVIYGNCHMSVLSKYLSKNNYFIQEYTIKTFLVFQKEKTPPVSLLKKCNLIILQDIRKENKNGLLSVNEIDEIISPKCKKIIVPNLFGLNLFFPQAQSPYIDKSMQNIRFIDSIQNGPINWMIGWHDDFIEKGLTAGKDASNIAIEILENNVFKNNEIRDNFNKRIDKLKEREKKCNIKISDFILDNYREKLLFYDPWHPTNYIIEEKCRRILDLLGIKEDNFESESHLDCREIFIYGCVRKELGLVFEQTVIRKNTCSGTLYNRGITLNEYIKQYKIWISRNLE